jgi:hypothetical protein
MTRRFRDLFCGHMVTGSSGLRIGGRMVTGLDMLGPMTKKWGGAHTRVAMLLLL